jgi:hypothetical protein
LVVIVVLGAGLLLKGGLPLVGGHGESVEYTTERGSGATQGTVDSPLKITLRVPWSTGSPDTALAAVAVQLLDASGNPARVGPGVGEYEAMRPALEIGVWVYDGSVPSVPGDYHARFVLQRLSGPTDTVEVKSPALTAVASSGPLLASGYVFARNANLWLLSTDATRERRLTFVPSFYEYVDNAAWSPDGKQIAYTYSPKTAPDEEPRTEIWAIAPDGTSPHAILRHGKTDSITEPAWSADGGSLYVTVQTSASASGTPDPMATLSEAVQIDKIDVASGARSQWMPNATMANAGAAGVAFIERLLAQDETGGVLSKYRLKLANADGQHARTLVDENAYQTLYAPAISPDGKWVVFAATSAPPPQSSRFDFWSWLMLQPQSASAHGLPWELYLVSAEGGAPAEKITNLNEDQPHATWLDSSTIAFMGTTGLYKFTIGPAGKATSDPTKVHPGAPHGGLSWHAP